MSDIKPFPPTNNTERYLAAILEELRATRDLVDRLLLVALEDPKPAVSDFSIGIVPVDQEDPVFDRAPIQEHVMVNRLKCSCGFSVNPKTFALMRQHMAEHHPEK